jgi:O-6-methylguanine DNA methyltransferase
MNVTTCDIATPDGIFTAHYSEEGLAQLDFPEKNKRSRATTATDARIRAWHKLTTRAVQSAVGGKPAAALPPLDLRSGTAFQQQIWCALQKIRTGKTATYSEVAASVRRPKAARATGSACGANPIPLLIPCHRVLAAGGKLGGFSGGLDWKRKLLQREKSSGLTA